MVVNIAGMSLKSKLPGVVNITGLGGQHGSESVVKMDRNIQMAIIDTEKGILRLQKSAIDAKENTSVLK